MSNCRQRVLLGQRQEHLDAVVSFAGASQRRRLFRSTLSPSSGRQEICRKSADSSSTRNSCSKQFDDDEWIRSLTEVQEVTTDVPEDSVTYEQHEVDLQKVRPFQKEEFLRKYVLRRLVALIEGEIAALTTSIPQIAVGPPGGAEALAIFHHLLCDEWMTGSLSGPLARIKVDEKNCFGMIEWQAVREAVSRFLPKHTAATAWKHRNLCHVEQKALPPMPKDRGAEQGDV